MQEINSKTFYPFTVKQLMYFEEELREAAGFDTLMRMKDALRYREGVLVIVEHDVEEYKTKHLTGIYEPLQNYYQTLTPYTFWARMLEMLKKAKKLL